jgi:hypothetical protein
MLHYFCFWITTVMHHVWDNVTTIASLSLVSFTTLLYHDTGSPVLGKTYGKSVRTLPELSVIVAHQEHPQNTYHAILEFWDHEICIQRNAGMTRSNCKEAVSGVSLSSDRLPSFPTLLSRGFPWRTVPIRHDWASTHVLAHTMYLSDNRIINLPVR